MDRNILIAIIFVAVTAVILTFVVMQDKLVFDGKLQNKVNLTNHENLINTNLTDESTKISRTLEPNENTGRIAGLQDKCLGSALCPD
jgi:hypothetical protein